MLPVWLQDLESLEAISQDGSTLDLVLRMAYLSGTGNIAPFLAELDGDKDIDPATKATFAELACDAWFLHLVEDYVHRTRAVH